MQRRDSSAQPSPIVQAALAVVAAETVTSRVPQEKVMDLDADHYPIHDKYVVGHPECCRVERFRGKTATTHARMGGDDQRRQCLYCLWSMLDVLLPRGGPGPDD